MTPALRNRLAKLTAKAEQLRLRDEQHDKMVGELAASMADNASKAVERHSRDAERGDPDAIHRHYRASEGRYLARRIAGGDE